MFENAAMHTDMLLTANQAEIMASLVERDQVQKPRACFFFSNYPSTQAGNLVFTTGFAPRCVAFSYGQRDGNSASVLASRFRFRFSASLAGEEVSLLKRSKK